MWLDKDCKENAADLLETVSGRKFVMSLLIDLLNDQTIMQSTKFSESAALERSNIAKAIKIAFISTPRGLINLRLAEDERYENEKKALDKPGKPG